MGYYKNGVLIFASDLGVAFFMRTQLGIDRFLEKNFFLTFDLKGVIEKYVGCFIVYLFLRGLFIKKM